MGLPLLPGLLLPFLSSDDDCFTNHFGKPNKHLVDGCTVAVRDIQPGEEIATDCREFGMTLPLDL